MRRWLPIFALLVACGGERSVHIAVTTSIEPSIRVGSERIEIPAGLAVGVRAQAVEDEIIQSELDVDLVAVNAGFVGIEPALEHNEWVIYGVSAGRTDVELFVEGDLVGDIPAIVVESHPTD